MITAQMVKDLREKTGAGMMDCKKALAEAGNMEGAIAYLREKGLAQAAKKAGRVAADGLVGICIQDGVAAMVEVNCETDFVAKTPEFGQLVSELAQQLVQAEVASEEVSDGDVMLTRPFVGEAGKTVGDVITEKVAKIGEKIAVRRLVRLSSANAYGSYIHSGGSIGAIVALQVADAGKAKSAEVLALAKNIAMHAAAAAPLFLNRSQVTTANLDAERAIYKAQALEQGKPEAVVDRIVSGKIEKYYGDVCLLEQAYVKDPDLTIAKVIAAAEKEIGCGIELKAFMRFKVGEGIEKVTSDLASEVAKMVA